MKKTFVRRSAIALMCVALAWFTGCAQTTDSSTSGDDTSSELPSSTGEDIFKGNTYDSSHYRLAFDASDGTAMLYDLYKESSDSEGTWQKIILYNYSYNSADSKLYLKPKAMCSKDGSTYDGTMYTSASEFVTAFASEENLSEEQIALYTKMYEIMFNQLVTLTYTVSGSGSTYTFTTEYTSFRNVGTNIFNDMYVKKTGDSYEAQVAANMVYISKNTETGTDGAFYFITEIGSRTLTLAETDIYMMMTGETISATYSISGTTLTLKIGDSEYTLSYEAGTAAFTKQ